MKTISMKKITLNQYPILFLTLIIVLIIVGTAEVSAKHMPRTGDHKLFFVENRCQIKDQHNNPRSDIRFAIREDGTSVFVGNTAVHYQFYKYASDSKQQSETLPCDMTSPAIPSFETYRLDVQLEGANKSAQFVAEDIQPYYEMYFLPGCPPGGVRANTYHRLTVKNVYPLIDWVMVIENNMLEQEFVVHSGGDASMIKLKYSGQTALNINEDGSVTATTPFGIVKEKPPVCYLGDGNEMTVSYKLTGDVLSYNTCGRGQAFVLDPTVEWGTYYGPDTNTSPIYGMACDDSANLYACGFTYATSGDIATSGSFHDTCGGQGDAYLVKFDSSGNRIWSTYYGGSNIDWGYSVSCDHAENVYMAGWTASVDTGVIATPGSHQPYSGGGRNGFLVKFNAAGDRIWATYYGGNEADIIYSVNCDTSWHVYIAGVATSMFNVATLGSFEPSFSNPFVQYTAGFLAKFDSSGVCDWGTYYEAFDSTGLNDVMAVTCATDGSNAYLSGFTGGTDSVATAGSWQPANGGGASDDFVAKFDAAGNRVWATFYGGAGQELTGSVACDGYGNVFLFGATYSDTGIASDSCFQPTRAGGADAFLAKFEPVAGMRQWGTYYGGPADETVNWTKIASDRYASVYVTGLTQSLSGIASSGAWQTIYGGGDHDGFLAKYDGSGNQLWSTYFGGSGDDQAFACTFDGLNVYICGKTYSTSGIATTSGFDTLCDGDSLYNKGFIAKFSDPDSAYISLNATKILSRNIEVYPIPATDYINIAGLAVNDHLRLYDEMGRTLTACKIQEASLCRLAIGALSPGAYFLTVYNSNGTVVVQKLVQKI